ncbi:MAG: C39 family peptidase [bacterium]
MKNIYLILFLVTLSILTFLSQLTTQVKIREKVILSPKPQAAAAIMTTTTTNVLTVRLEFSAGTPIGFWAFCDCSGAYTEVGSGDTYRVYEVSYTSNGDYELRIFHYGWPTSAVVNVKVIAPGSSDHDTTVTIPPYYGWGSPPMSIVRLDGYTLPSIYRVGLDIGRTTISPSGENSFSVYPAVGCSGIPFDVAHDPVTLTIIDGREYGQFYSDTGSPLGYTVSKLLGDISGVKFIAVDSIGAGSSATVVVSAEINSLVAINQFQIVPPVFPKPKLKLTMEPMLIVHGESEQIMAQAYLDGDPVALPPGEKYRFEVIQGGDLVGLYSATHQGGGNVLENIEPSIEGSARVLLEATGREPMGGGEEVTICVSSSSAEILPDTMSVSIVPNTLAITVDPGKITFGERSLLDVKQRLPGGEIVPVPQDCMIMFAIAKNYDAGHLTAMDGSSTGDRITGFSPQVWFQAEEEIPMPDSVEVCIYIAVVKGDGSGEQEIEYGIARVTVIKKVECARIDFERSRLSPGDTTRLSFKKLKDGGTLEEYAADQLFNVWLITNSEYGKLRGNGMAGMTEGTELYSVTQPVYFIAADTLSVDSISVGIVVEAIAGGGEAGIAVKHQTGGKGLSKQAAQSSSRAMRLAQAIQQRLLMNDCPVPSGSVVIQNNKFDSLSVRWNPQEIQTSESSTLSVSAYQKKKTITPSKIETFAIGILPDDQEYGNLTNGDGGSGKTFSGVPFQNISAGKIKFVADGTVPPLWPVGIGVMVSGGENILAQGAVLVNNPNSLAKYFRQTDTSWNIDTLGYSKGTTIGSKGCALTCVAMVLNALGFNTNPRELNIIFKAPENKCFDYAALLWWRMKDYFRKSSRGIVIVPNTLDGYTKNTPSTSHSKLDQALIKGPVIVSVWNEKSDRSHWVIVTSKTTSGEYRIIDPSYTESSTLSQYRNIFYSYVQIITKGN